MDNYWGFNQTWKKKRLYIILSQNLLGAIVRKYRESGARSKKIDFFYFTKIALLVNYFQKQMNIQKF